MAVRIVKDYWVNYHNHEDLIKRCFHYLFRKFPTPDGSDDSFNNVLVRLMSLNVFDRFAASRLVGINEKKLRKEGKTPRQIDCIIRKTFKGYGVNIHKMRREGASEEEINHTCLDALEQHQVVNVNKKFEQFIYKWVEHFVEEAYQQYRLDRNRFARGMRMDLCHQSVYSQQRRKHGILAWDTEGQAQENIQKLRVSNEHKTKRKGRKQRIRKTRSIRCFPHIMGTSGYMTPRPEQPDGSIREQELYERIKAQLRDDKELRIVEMRYKDGMSCSDIALHMGCTPANISLIVRNIYARCHSLCAAVS